MKNYDLRPYEHKHVGIDDLGWEGAGKAFQWLGELIAENFTPEAVVGIAKGGVVPGVFLASIFLVDFFPIKLSSRKNEVVVRKKPKWFVRPTSDIKGKHVLLVDDICVAGRTLKIAKKALLDKGAVEVRTATLAIHSDSARPDYYVIESDALIIFPWDKLILSGLQWVMNPEYQQEIDSIRNQ